MWVEQLMKLFEDRGGKDKTMMNASGKRSSLYLGSLWLESKRGGYNREDVNPVYNLGDVIKKGTLPLKKIYLEVSDPTEYTFATMCFYDYKHFQKMMENKIFKRFIDACRDELELKLRSEAVMRIREQMKGKGPSAITASKYIIERGWIGNKKEREAVVRRQKHDIKINETIESDLKLLETNIPKETQVA